MHQENEPETDKLGAGESLLRAEILFWRELIDSTDLETASTEKLERMQQALALAEYRLSHFATELQESSGQAACRVSARRSN